MMHHRYRLLAAPCILSALLAAAPAAGQQYAETPEQPPSRVAFSGGVDFTTQYFFRGILQEDSGFIAQPYIEVSIALYEAGDAGILNGISAYAGNWNSLHSKETGTESDADVRIWYETDFYGGFVFTLLNDFEAGVGYSAYISPNSAFDTAQEINLTFAYDDGKCWAWLDVPGFTGLVPYVAFAFETKNGADGGTEGIYAEIGIEPSFSPLAQTLPDLTLAIPMTLGLNIDDYYEDGGHDHTFGFFDLGFVFGHPIMEHVSLSAGVHLLWLGDGAASFNDGDGANFEVIGVVGVSVDF